MSRFSRTIRIVAVNALVFAALVAAVELGSSFFVEMPAGNIIDDYRLNHTWRPNSTWLHDEWAASNPDFPEPYLHEYNSQGWLMRYDIQKEKPKGTYRIFYLGDSFTEGTAPMEGSVPSLVGSALDSTYAGDGLRFEVINTGTSSYSPTIFYVLVRYYIMEYSPDLIVLDVDMTDDYDDWKYSKTLLADEDGNPFAVPPRDVYEGFVDTPSGAARITVWDKARLFLLQRSNFYNLVWKLRSGKSATEGPAWGLNDTDGANADAGGNGGGLYGRWAWCQHEWDGTVQMNVGRTLDMLKRTAQYCKRNGVKLMITSVPHYYQYAGYPDPGGRPYFSARPHYAIEGLSQKIGVPYLNSFEMLAPYIQGTPQGQYYYNEDMHFNPRGYEIWARAQLDFLLDRRNGLLPDEVYGKAERSR